MPEAKKKPTQAGNKVEGEVKPKGKRTNFSDLYPEDAKLTLLVEENPKKQGSKSRERFEAYFKASTVGEALRGGITYQDIVYDIGHGFIKVG